MKKPMISNLDWQPELSAGSLMIGFGSAVMGTLLFGFAQRGDWRDGVLLVLATGVGWWGYLGLARVRSAQFFEEILGHCLVVMNVGIAFLVPFACWQIAFRVLTGVSSEVLPMVAVALDGLLMLTVFHLRIRRAGHSNWATLYWFLTLQLLGWPLFLAFDLIV